MKRQALDRLLMPESVAVLGSPSRESALVLANLREGGFTGPILSAGPADLAVIAGGDVAAHLAGLRGGAAIVLGQAPAHDAKAPGSKAMGAQAMGAQALGELARQHGVRVLGPNSFGLAIPRLGLNASLSHMQLPRGHVALVTQSASLARAVVDWAGPNGVGFSHVVGIGGNSDVGFGEVLDYLARETETRLILLDIRRVRERRAFISAARAASRLRPVVALRPGGRLLDPSGRSDAVFAAALNRAGVFVVHSLEAFLAAAETLSRARPLRGETMAVITNAIGPGRLAADAALRAGIELAILPAESQQTLTVSLPAELTLGLIYAGSAAPTDVASIAAMISAVPGVGGVLVLLTPTGQGDAAAIQAVIAAAHTAQLPVLTCVMGETTGAHHRRRLAEAGLPAFATPEQAVQAFGHLVRDRAARRAARELPPGRVLDIAPDHRQARAILAAARAHGRLALDGAQSSALLACYGVSGTEPPAGPALTIRVHDDAMFGPAISVASPPDGPQAYDLPPLNLTLATTLAERGGLRVPAVAPAAACLVRISQLLLDIGEIDALEIDRLTLGASGIAGFAQARVILRPPGEQARLAISPYPEELVGTWHGGDRDFIIRPIRPEDAEAHAGLIARVPAQDLRYRFFSAMRQVAPEQMGRLTQIDYDREMAFIAVQSPGGATVGVARLVCEPGGATGEFAILVEPASKGLGLARHLMDRLIAWARSRGVATITGQILADNHPMLAFVRRLGFSLKHLPDEADVVEAVLELHDLFPDNK